MTWNKGQKIVVKKIGVKKYLLRMTDNFASLSQIFKNKSHTLRSVAIII